MKNVHTTIAFLAFLMAAGLGKTHSQTITEIHYHNSPYHVPNSVCQSKDGNILVQCNISQDNEKVGSKLLKFNKQGICLDSLFIDDEAEVWAFINANPLGDGDIMASIRSENSVVSVRILHLDNQCKVSLQHKRKSAGLGACRFHHEGMKKLFTLVFVSLTMIRRTNAEKVTAKERKTTASIKQRRR